MARSRSTADTQTASGGPVSPFIAGKNYLINGGMDIWQRGTSFTASGVYTADRWYNGSNTAQTFSRQTTSDTTNLPSIQYCIRAQRNSGTSNTNIIGISQSIETVNSIPMAGKTVTVSYYARAGANLSGTVTATLYSGTGTDQRRDFGAGFTGEATVVTANPSLTTTWTRYTITGTVATTATELAVLIYFIPVGTAGAADYIEVTGVQLEIGQSATPFSRAGGTIQGELAACMRYCQMFNASEANGAFLRYGVGQNIDTTQTFTQIPLSPPMRVVPSLTTTGTAADYGVYSRNTVTACNSAPVLGGNSVSPKTLSVYATVASGLTQGNAMQLTSNNNTTSYLLLTAEL